MKNYFKIITLFFAASASLTTSAQDSTMFSLQQAQEYAIKHNYDYLSKEKDVLIAKRKVWETTAIGLPQVNGNVDFKNFLKLPTTVIPAQAFNPAAPPGQLVGVQFGTDYNTTAAVNVSQLVFDGSYIVGLQAAKTYKALSTTQLQKTEQEVKEDIAQSYYTVLLAKENLDILDSSLSKVKNLFSETEKIYQQGLVEEQNVDQLKLTLKTIETTLQNAKNQYELVQKLLKFKMGYPVNAPITLTDNKEKFITDLTITIPESFTPSQTIDLQLAGINERLMKLNWRKEKFSFLPSIGAFYSHQQQNLTNDFEVFNSNATWYPGTLWGISIKMPLFTSGMRLSKLNQAKLNFEKAKIQSLQAEQAVWIKFTTLKAELENAYNSYLTEKENLQLSEKIRQRTVAKYREGMASSMELTQAQNQFLTTEGKYIQALLNVLIKQSELNKLINNK